MIVNSLEECFRQYFPSVSGNGELDVPELVEALLQSARAAGASDIHLIPTPHSLDIRWRMDGVLQNVVEFPRETVPKIVSRLKVLAELLTYRTDVPQEGRLRDATGQSETRLSTFPTMYGEKAVVRLFAGAGRYLHLDELGFPDEILAALRRLLGETSGVIMLTGPAGSGKTTTIYACLREIVNKSDAGRSLVSLEDPIEVAVEGVSQSQVKPSVGFDMHAGLRSLLRQDPEVILVGEIRDRLTAETVFQASLTGHLVLTTFHAGSAARAISRLSDMDIEPYLLRSGTRAIFCQRLLRALCSCARKAETTQVLPGLDAAIAHVPVGCETCRGTGYHGRFVLSEMLEPDANQMGRAILSRSDASRLEELAVDAGMVTQRVRALEAVRAGKTSVDEIIRTFGVAAGTPEVGKQADD